MSESKLKEDHDAKKSNSCINSYFALFRYKVHKRHDGFIFDVGCIVTKGLVCILTEIAFERRMMKSAAIDVKRNNFKALLIQKIQIQNIKDM